MNTLKTKLNGATVLDGFAIAGTTAQNDRDKARTVVAGMEGALASVIGGLADCPVIAVPTSVGYGASFNGLFR